MMLLIEEVKSGHPKYISTSHKLSQETDHSILLSVMKDILNSLESCVDPGVKRKLPVDSHKYWNLIERWLLSQL
jgi:hypothetical protein